MLAIPCRYVSLAVGLALASTTSATAAAQSGPAGTRLSVETRVVNVEVVNGVTTVTYQLVNSLSSAEQVFAFTVDAPTGVLTIVAPSPQEDWATATQSGQRTVAAWAVLGDALMPGTTGPELRMSARGRPGLVSYWVQGFAPPPPAPSDPDAPDLPQDVLTSAFSVPGVTLGVLPPLAGSTRLDWISDLLATLKAACGPATLIDNLGVCQALQAKLDAAGSAAQEGRDGAARGELGAFLNQLEAQRGKHVTDAAYWALRSAARAALAFAS